MTADTCDGETRTERETDRNSDQEVCRDSNRETDTGTDMNADTGTGIDTNIDTDTDTPCTEQTDVHARSLTDRSDIDREAGSDSPTSVCGGRSRRSVLRGVAAIGTATVGLGTVGSLSEPVQASDAIVSDITADDTAVTNNDGTIHAVYLEPELTIDWQHFGDGVNAVDILIRLTVDETSSTVYQELLTHKDAGDRVEITDTSDSFDAVSGSIDLAFDRVDITDEADEIDESDFSDGSVSAGESETTTVEVLVNTVIDGNDGEHETIDVGQAFDVTITNPDGEAGINGTMNTDAE